MGIYGYMHIQWILQFSSKFRRIVINISPICCRMCVFNFLKCRQHFIKVSYKCPVSESPSRVRLVVAACGASATSEKNTSSIFGACILSIESMFMDLMPPWKCFSKTGQYVQMTMPARRASEFSAKRRAVSPEMFFSKYNFSNNSGIL